MAEFAGNPIPRAASTSGGGNEAGKPPETGVEVFPPKRAAKYGCDVMGEENCEEEDGEEVGRIGEAATSQGRCAYTPPAPKEAGWKDGWRGSEVVSAFILAKAFMLLMSIPPTMPPAYSGNC
jgi:hypothetical protein